MTATIEYKVKHSLIIETLLDQSKYQVLAFECVRGDTPNSKKLWMQLRIKNEKIQFAIPLGISKVILTNYLGKWILINALYTEGDRTAWEGSADTSKQLKTSQQIAVGPAVLNY